MKWAPWLVRTIIFGGLGLLLAISIGGRIRADRALERVRDVEKRGTPGEVAAVAQQAVSTFTGEPSVVIDVEAERDWWRATAMAGTTCYELAVVDDRTSAHPGKVPCPPIEAAGPDDDPLPLTDPRRLVIEMFLGDWLTGDPEADRYLTAERPSQRLLPDNADHVKLVNVWGGGLPTQPGSRTILTAQADVQYPDRTERLGWTIVLRLEGQRWAVEQLAGGEIPEGDSVDLTVGITGNTTTTVRH